MGLHLTGISGYTAMYDSVTDWAFGPVFTSPENAEQFLAWAESQGVRNGDVRQLSNDRLAELSDRYFASGGDR